MEEGIDILEMPSNRWVLALSYARMHPIKDSTNPEHSPRMYKCWHVVCRMGSSVIDEYGNRVKPILKWQECPEGAGE